MARPRTPPSLGRLDLSPTQAMPGVEAGTGLPEQLLQHAPIGIAVIDGEGRYVSVNPAYCAMYGWDREEMLGRRFTMVFAPARHEQVLARHRDFVERGGELKGEWEVLRRDGAPLSVIAESVGVPGPSGRPLRLVYVMDITPLKQAQAATLASEALMRDLAASLPGVLFRFVTHPARTWRFTYLSPGLRRLYGIEPEQGCADNRALWSAILPADREAHDASLRRAVERTERWEHEFRIRTVADDIRWVHAQAQPQPGTDGEVVWTGVLSDISERRRIEAELQDREETYRTLFETVPQGVVYHDMSGRITAANPAALRILDLTLDQLQGRSPFDPRWRAVREDGSDLPGDQHPVMVALRTGREVRNILMGVVTGLHDPADEGSTRQVWIVVSATPVYRGAQLHQVYSSFEDVTDRVRLSRELQRQATTDELTGLANRRSLMHQLAQALERVRRHPEARCSVLEVDLDHFKRINDQWGHAAGDAMLRHVTALMQQQARQIDLVARSGGEEFVILLPDTQIEEALALARRLRTLLELSVLNHEGRDLAITASIGVSAVSAGDAGIDEVLVRADRALYEVKAAGRNGVGVAWPKT